MLDYAEVVLNRDDIDAKADAFIDFLAERVVGREYHDETLRGKPFTVQSFADLEEFFRPIFDFMEGAGEGLGRCGRPITSPPSGRSATG